MPTTQAGLPEPSDGVDSRLLQFLNASSDDDDDIFYSNTSVQEPREQSVEQDEETSPSATPQGSELSRELLTPLTLRNSAATLVRMARRQQLHPYQVTKVENLMTVSA